MNKLIWSPDLTELLTQYYPNHGATVVVGMMRRKYGINPPHWKVIAKAKRMGIRYTGPRKAWKKGNRPHNAGQRMPASTYEKVRRTMFKPGNQPVTALPDGAITERKAHGGVRLYIRIAGQWQMLAHHVWQQHNGPIPPAHVIRYLDGNPRNCDISNLAIVSRAEMARANYDASRDRVRRSLRIAHANRRRGGLSFVDAVLQGRI